MVELGNPCGDNVAVTYIRCVCVYASVCVCVCVCL